MSRPSVIRLRSCFLSRAAQLFTGAGLLLWASSSLAQQLDNEVSVQRFDPAPGAGNFLTTRSAAVSGHLTWTAGMLVNYGYDPFSVSACSDACDTADPIAREINVVENMVTADVLASLTLIERLQLGLKIPVSWVKGHGAQLSEDGGVEPQDGGLSAVGLGDIQLEVKGRFYGEPAEPIIIGGYVYGTAPTGVLTAEGSYIGNSSPSVGGAVIVDGALGPFSYGVNLGGVYRATAEIGGSTTIGPEARFGIGLGYQISPILAAVADVFSGTDFNSNDLGASSVEGDLALRVTPFGDTLTFQVGGGAGLYRGVGTPVARALLGVTYNSVSNDRDGDGFPDNKDACPDAAEDMDGFEDGDGCPELDNDQDGLPDEADKCKDAAEDVDGFEDKDGCPDPDNDQDGIPDVSDRCPNEPESKNGFEDEDGCPDVKDTDADGVPDDRDQCVDEPEDTDGFEDTDGCPDPDNDGDGIPDEQDECIDEPEDGKGKDQELTDGCPQEE